MLCLLSERPTASLQPGANVTLNDCLRAGLILFHKPFGCLGSWILYSSREHHFDAAPGAECNRG